MLTANSAVPENIHKNIHNPQKGLEFPWAARFSRTKTLKEKYQAKSEFSEGLGAL